MNFYRAWAEKERWERIRSAEEKKTCYSKMVKQTRMSKKRLKKVLMASGMRRDRAEEIAGWAGCVGQGRLFWYRNQLPFILERIDNRHCPEERVVEAVVGELSPELRENLRELHRTTRKKNYLSDKARFEKLLAKYAKEGDGSKEIQEQLVREILANGWSTTCAELAELKSWLRWGELAE